MDQYGEQPQAPTAPTQPATPRYDSGLGPLVDAVAYGNTQAFDLQRQQVQSQIDLANKNYVLARNADQRAQAMLELQRWQAEMNRIQHQQEQYTSLAKVLVSAAAAASSNPANYFQANKMMAGGRDIFQQASGGAPPAFTAVAGRPQSGDVADYLTRLGMPKYPQTTSLGDIGTIR